MSYDDIKKNRYMAIVLFSFISTLTLTTTLLLFVIFHDTLFYRLYDISSTLESEGLIKTWMLNSIEDVINVGSTIPAVLDYLWLASFILMVLVMFKVSYSAKRDGYFSTLAFITYGIMVLLFFGSIISQVSDWYYDIMINGLLKSFNTNIPLFSYYILHQGLINMIIIFICVILNFIDFDMIKFYTRKDKEEMIDNEI